MKTLTQQETTQVRATLDAVTVGQRIRLHPGGHPNRWWTVAARAILTTTDPTARTALLTMFTDDDLITEQARRCSERWGNTTTPTTASPPRPHRALSPPESDRVPPPSLLRRGDAVAPRPQNTNDRVPDCPECTAGKHTNCDGTTWNPTTDQPQPCPCTHHTNQQQQTN